MLLPPAGHTAELTAQELRGKNIYFEGVSGTGQAVSARVGRGTASIPASAVPCASCHGADGRGRPEGGIVPADITWAHLTRPYGHRHQYGREHPAFEETSLMRAITTGVDPAGNRLDMAMPRYAMAEQDLRDLIAYIQRLEADLDPGITATTLRLGTLLPRDGALAGLGRSMRRVLEAYFADLNGEGGVHGRRIELVVGDYTTDRTAALWNARDLLEQGDVFALISPFIVGMENDLGEFVREKRIPVVGPYTFFAEHHADASPYSFHLLAGLAQQAQLLMKYANQQLELDNPQTAVIYPEGESYAGLLERLKNQATGLGWPAPIHSAHKPGEWDMASAVRRLQAQAVELVFFLGPASALREFTERAAAARWQPYILRPGVIGGQGIFDLAADFTDRVFLAYPSLPVDHTAQGVQEFESLHARHGLDFAYSRAQISAFTAAQVMAEALKRAGRALSREHLITALEGLNEYRPGLMPAISYTSTRRIGALGGYVVALDLPNRRFGPPSKWIPLEP